MGGLQAKNAQFPSNVFVFFLLQFFEEAGC